jgi:MYXO-CTERM domain-containing protein
MNESTLLQTGIWLAAGAALFVFLRRRRSKRAHH